MSKMNKLCREKCASTNGNYQADIHQRKQTTGITLAKAPCLTRNEICRYFSAGLHAQRKIFAL
jgi:hypothetical protein